MRSTFALLLLSIGLAAPTFAQTPTCTGLACQQQSCPGLTSTTITGYVYAPNGKDPLPNVTVYIPNAPVDAFQPGVQCPLPGTPPSGSPLVGTTTGTDGKFIMTNVPVGASIPLVIVSGRWRRQVVVPATAACGNTNFDVIFPKNASEGDIPKIAIATGSVDQVECVLLKVGLDKSEFTDFTDNGRINFFQGDGNVAKSSGGAVISSSTPKETALMGNSAMLNKYDVLMLPCEGGNYTRAPQQLANLIQFANSGGRVYASHFGYSWMYNNPPFNTVANWSTTNKGTASSGMATVDTSFSEGKTLSDWLQLVDASTTPGQMQLLTIKHDVNGVNPPTQSWLTLNTKLDSDPQPVMQFVFDTPVGATSNQCGRVLFNEYHVENNAGSSGVAFPNECATASTMTPQEKLLEYSLFELTDDGGAPALAPTEQYFGAEPVGFTTSTKTFTWTNNSTFDSIVYVAPASGDFAITSTTCGPLAGGKSCQINVAFKPTAVGARAGVLSISAGAQTLTASLTGSGIPDLSSSPAALDFGNVDVGASASQAITITSNAPAAVPFPALVATGDYSIKSTCGTSVPALATCTLTVTFSPKATGPSLGTLSANSADPSYSGLTTQLTGNGVDFTITILPTSGTTISGVNATTAATITPIAGFAASVSLSCQTNANASTCLPTLAAFVPSSVVSTVVTITTTPHFTVVGYGSSLGGGGLLSFLAFGSGWLLWMKRKSTNSLLRCGLAVCFLAASSGLITGCSGKLPASNSSYTTPGDYTYTLTATDGFLVHTATYTLHVTAK